MKPFVKTTGFGGPVVTSDHWSLRAPGGDEPRGGSSDTGAPASGSNCWALYTPGWKPMGVPFNPKDPRHAAARAAWPGEKTTPNLFLAFGCLQGSTGDQTGWYIDPARPEIGAYYSEALVDIPEITPASGPDQGRVHGLPIDPENWNKGIEPTGMGGETGSPAEHVWSVEDEQTMLQWLGPELPREVLAWQGRYNAAGLREFADFYLDTLIDWMKALGFSSVKAFQAGYNQWKKATVLPENGKVSVATIKAVIDLAEARNVELDVGGAGEDTGSYEEIARPLREDAQAARELWARAKLALASSSAGRWLGLDPPPAPPAGDTGEPRPWRYEAAFGLLHEINAVWPNRSRAHDGIWESDEKRLPTGPGRAVFVGLTADPDQGLTGPDIRKILTIIEKDPRFLWCWVGDPGIYKVVLVVDQLANNTPWGVSPSPPARVAAGGDTGSPHRPGTSRGTVRFDI